MAKDLAEIDRLETEKKHSEKAKIPFVEALIVVLFSLSADAPEAFAALANFLPVIGQAFWLFTLFSGFLVSAGILIWTVVRGAYGKFFMKRLIMIAFGVSADALLGGFLPVRTAALIATIWISNHSESKNIKRIVKILG